MKSFGTSDIRAWLPQGDVAPPWPEVLGLFAKLERTPFTTVFVTLSLTLYLIRRLFPSALCLRLATQPSFGTVLLILACVSAVWFPPTPNNAPTCLTDAASPRNGTSN